MAKEKIVGELSLEDFIYRQLLRRAAREERDPMQQIRWMLKVELTASQLTVTPNHLRWYLQDQIDKAIADREEADQKGDTEGAAVAKAREDAFNAVHIVIFHRAAEWVER